MNPSRINVKRSTPRHIIIKLSKDKEKRDHLGFPGGAVVESPPTSVGNMGFEPWSGKIPHAAEQLSWCTTTTETCVPRAHALQQEKPPQ